ncbi:MAG: response regulator, partial [Actinomycetota bacterium]
VVDDHSGFRAWARRILEEDGLDVVGEAADGVGALEAVLQLRPSLVLLDVQLPDMSGFEVARRLAGLSCPSTVVLTSAQDASDVGHGIRSSGAAGFVAKAELSGRLLARLVDGGRGPAGGGGA